jgi:hypothetical protein
MTIAERRWVVAGMLSVGILVHGAYTHRAWLRMAFHAGARVTNSLSGRWLEDNP